MRIFKFGGASIRSVEAIQNVARILADHQEERLVVVISASGKTTNALEALLQAYYNREEALLNERLQTLKEFHQELLTGLMPDAQHPVYNDINDLWVDLEWILEEAPQDSYDYLYDQIVSSGELLSTTIVAAYLQTQGLNNQWLDVRDCILTDNTYREGGIDWTVTEQNIQAKVPALLDKGMVITQGFIGATTENFTTTLGREGSDYTAAIFAYCLSANDLTIWKDVPGVLTADPRRFEAPQLLERLSYSEAIEMTYYGAQVIHPKTLRPLQNKNIPLYVKSFVDTNGKGTVIEPMEHSDYPMMVVIKPNQLLLRMVSKDFYFVDEAKYAWLFDRIAHHRIKVNMTQNTAMAFSVCLDHETDRMPALLEELGEVFHIETTEQLQLVTLRHANDAAWAAAKKDSNGLLEERIGNTCQLVLPDHATITLPGFAPY